MTNNKTPSRQEMIDAIYDKIARKDLSFGCKVIIQYMDSDPEEEVIVSGYFEGSDYIKTTFYGIVLLSYIKKIIGHPVMIGDVINYFEENCIGILELYGVEYNSQGRRNLPKNIFILWKNKRKPIEEQSDDCIDFVYNLISK